MTEQQAKHARKLKQAVKDAMEVLPESYTMYQLSIDFAELQLIKGRSGERKLSTKMIAGLLKWQIDNL